MCQIIGLTAPRHNYGQTVSSVNIASSISSSRKTRVLLIDTNRTVRDLEKYLDNREKASGMDEFINLYDNGMWRDELLSHCIIETKFGLDFMPSSISSDLEDNHLFALISSASKFYNFVFIDVDHGLHQKVLPKCDLVIMLMAQSLIPFEEINRKPEFASLTERMIFVVNRYIEKYNGVRIGLSLGDIKRYLKKTIFSNSNLLALHYDGQMVNACNKNMLLHFTHGTMSSVYRKDMNALLEVIYLYTDKEAMLCKN